MRTSSYFGNPWLGMFVKTNDEITILPVDSMKKLEDAISEDLRTRPIRMLMAECNLLGVYVAMNSSGAVIPNVARAEEAAKLKEAGLNVYISKEPQNAHGNNIVVNSKGAIANPHLPRDEISRMSDALGVEVIPMAIAGYTTVGSACIATDNGFLAHFKANEDELSAIRDALKVDGSRGTMNGGTGFVSYGAVANRKGYIAGEASSAFEIGRMEDALGLVR